MKSKPLVLGALLLGLMADRARAFAIEPDLREEPSL